MDERDHIFEMRCAESRGEIVRTVRLVELTYEKLRYYYEKLSQFDVMFNDQMPNNFIAFASRFLGQKPDGMLVATGLIWEVDDVGILFMTGITDHQASIHFTFWDRQLKGREPLIKAMIKHGMERYGFERLEIVVGLYAKAALYAVERIGFVKEGRLRKVVRYNGEWYDANIYSVIREETEQWVLKMDQPVKKTLLLDSSKTSSPSLEKAKEVLRIS